MSKIMIDLNDVAIEKSWRDAYKHMIKHHYFGTLPQETKAKASAYIYAVSDLCDRLGLDLPVKMKQIKKNIFSTDEPILKLISQWTSDPTWSLDVTYDNSVLPEANNYRHQLAGYELFKLRQWSKTRKEELKRKALKLGVTYDTASYIDNLEREMRSMQDDITRMQIGTDHKGRS